MLSLAQNALSSSQHPTTHILFATESCLPLTTLSKSCLSLEKGKSYLNCYAAQNSRQCTRFDELECFAPLEQEGGIPRACLWKALPGWAVFSSQHMQKILDTFHVETPEFRAVSSEVKCHHTHQIPRINPLLLMIPKRKKPIPLKNKLPLSPPTLTSILS